MDNRWYIIGALVLIILAVLGIMYGQFSVIGGLGEQLDFCSTEQECIDYLENKGMPDNWLEENKITIECTGGVCYATE